jgi:DNA-binding NarL/FixJ family response regulator
MAIVMAARVDRSLHSRRPVAVAGPAPKSPSPAAAGTAATPVAAVAAAAVATAVVADPALGVRSEIAERLRETEFAVMGEVVDAEDVLRAVSDLEPDLLLLSVALAGPRLDLLWTLRRLHPRTAVVVLTPTPTDDECFDVLRAGAAGYLGTAIGATDRLADTLRAALQGQPVLSRAVVARLVAEFRERGGRWQALGPRTVSLTGRQWQILELLANDRPTREIAEQLGLAPVTVRAHTAAILKKLDLPHRQAVVELAAGRNRA